MLSCTKAVAFGSLCSLAKARRLSACAGCCGNQRLLDFLAVRQQLACAVQVLYASNRNRLLAQWSMEGLQNLGNLAHTCEACRCGLQLALLEPHRRPPRQLLVTSQSQLCARRHRPQAQLVQPDTTLHVMNALVSPCTG